MIAFPLKRWLLFVGECYYPKGGTRDLRGSFDTKAEAMGALAVLPAHYSGSWAILFDQQTGDESRWEASTSSMPDRGKPWTMVENYPFAEMESDE